MTALRGPLYLAGSWSDRPRLRGIRDELAALGIGCTATWLDQAGNDCRPIEEWAAIDLADLTAAQTVIVVTHIESTAGAMHAEFGIALGRNMPIIGVGPRTCLFHHLVPDDNWYPAWPELRAALSDEVFV